MSLRPTPIVPAALLVAALLLSAVTASAQDAAALQASPAEDRPAESGSNGAMRIQLTSTGAHTLSIPRGKSATVDLPMDARDVMLSNPGVAEPVMRSPRRISILGVAAGQTDAVFYDASGRRILALDIRVDQNFGAVADTIARILPNAHVRVEAVNNSIILSGQVASLADASRAVQIAQQFTAKPEQVLNMLSIEGKDQVMLRVRIVEVQRTVIKQLGFNLNLSTGKSGVAQVALTTAASFGINGTLLGGLNGGGVSYQSTTPGNGVNKASSTVDAFERVGLVRTLAEPNLTAVSGESAKFLAGGEFPVPTGEDNTGKVTIEFKPYGVGLGFTPVVLSGGRISLKVSTEVSELTSQGAFSLATSSTTSLTVPGLVVRRTETTVEMPSGGAMMISGLLQQESKQDLDSLPGLMNLPVLGALFRSRDYQQGETELVVIITPYIVSPTSPANLQTPADGLQLANDAETDLLGRMNKVYNTPAAAVAGRTYQGPVGYVIE